MAVTVYRWDDASAPVLSGTAGALTTVLDACLVNGYGSKPAAGWAIAFTGTNKRVYRAATGSRAYLRFDDSGTANARVRAAESMTDVDTITGNPCPTDVQISGGGYLIKSSSADSTARPWVLVADGLRFHLYVGYNDTTAIGLASTAYRHTYFFGDIASYLPGDSFNFFMILATGSSSSNNYGAATSDSNANAQSGHYILRATDQVTTSIAYSKGSDKRVSGSGLIGSGGVAYPDPVTGGMLLSQVFATQPTQLHVRGRIPGLWAPLHSLPASPGDTFSGAGALAGRTFILLDSAAGSTRGRIALETSDTWST